MAGKHDTQDLIAAIDVGSHKVMVTVGRASAQGELQLAGFGLAPSQGIKRGVVVNIEAAVQSISQAVREAELMAGATISHVYASISGGHIRGFNSEGMVAIREQEVTPQDVSRVIEAARAVPIPSDQRLLLVEPQEYVIDGQEVKEPVGMNGRRLDTRVHMVTGAYSAAENILKCIRRCGLEVEHLMLSPLAASTAVLTEDEKELGVALIDIGAGTTDIALYTNGCLRHTAVVPIAGELITSDIAMALRTPTKDAEEIKLQFGYAKQLLADPKAQVQVPGLGDRDSRSIGQQALAGVIEPRVEEIYTLVQQIVRSTGYEDVLGSGYVITGGACAMPGMVEMAEDVFCKQVRRGVYRQPNPIFDLVRQPHATVAMGLLEEAWRSHQRGARVQQHLQGSGLFSGFKRFFANF